jgi:hypothetical protein
MPFSPKSSGGGRFVASSPSGDLGDDKSDADIKPGKIGREAIGGAATAWASPEILTGLGMASEAGGAMFPPAAPVLEPLGAALMGAGTAARTARTAAPFLMAGGGAAAGAAGEIGAQGTKMAGGGPLAQESARLVTGAVTPVFGGAIAKAASKMVGRLVGFNPTQIYREILAQTGLPEESLTSTQRAHVKRVADQISAGTPTLPESAQAVRSTLESGAERLRADYTSQAGMLEFQANQLVKEAQATAKDTSGAAARRIDSLMKQFNESASRLLSTAESRASAIRKNAQTMADGIRAKARQAAPQVRAQAEAQAADILKQGEAQSAAIRAEGRAQVDRMRTIAGKARAQVAARSEKAAASLRSVGTPETRTALGEKVRGLIKPYFDKLKAVREANAEKNKGDAFSFAEMKERQAAQRRGLLEAGSGGTVKDTKAYPEAMRLIDNELSKTTLSDIRGPLERIRKALSGDIRFASLERMRRFLRDRASGLPAEGYDAISQQVSGDLASAIEAVQVEYSPAMRRFLDQYKIDSQPLNDFRTKLGKQIMGQEDFDWGRFTVDPANIPASIFKTKGNVDLLIQMSGGDKGAAEGIARSFVADTLQNADAAAVRRFISSPQTRDWIDTFPSLKADLENAANLMERAGSVASRRQTLSNALRTKAQSLLGGLPGKMEAPVKTAETEAEKLRAAGITGERKALEEGEKSAEEALSESEKAALKVTSEAEKARKAGVGSVRRQAGLISAQAEKEGKAAVKGAKEAAKPLLQQASQLSAKAQDVANRIVGKKFDELEVQKLILSGDRELWGEVAPIIRESPEAQRSLVDFVRRYMGDAARSSPRSVAVVFRQKIRPALEGFGLADAETIDRLNGQLAQLELIVEPEKRATMAQRMLMSAVSSEAGRPISAVLGLLPDLGRSSEMK